MDDSLPAVLTEIRSLLDVPPEEAPPRALVEDTLTTGYAYALHLERARMQVEESLRALLRGERRPEPREVEELRERLARAERELAGVRALLSDFRSHALA